MNKKYPFHALRDKETEIQFNNRFLKLLSDLDFIAVTIVIDKITHRELYSTWQYDPYHYCMAVMLERFIFFLEGVDEFGDVMSESRGGREDLRLKKSFRYLVESGTDFIASERIQSRLTSIELKVKPKTNNISGLQVADVIAHPSRRAVLISEGKVKNARTVFGDKIEEILQEKYYKSPTGEVWGFGKKLLP